jgi:cellulose biosynthesis protein BcsQ
MATRFYDAYRVFLKPEKEIPIMQVITVASRKGGVGKTHIAAAIAQQLDAAGKRVCLLDMDSQANASGVFTLTSIRGMTLQDWLDGAEPKWFVPERTGIKILRGISGDLRFTVSARNGDSDGTHVVDLKARLSTINDEFDYVVLDTPPAENDATFAAIESALFVLGVSDNHRFGSGGAVSILRKVRDDQVFLFVLNKYREKRAIDIAIKTSLESLHPNVVTVAEEAIVNKSTAMGRGFPTKGKAHENVLAITQSILDY